MIIDLLIPFYVDQFYPAIGMNAVKLLEKAGVEVHYNPEQTSCGQLAFTSGFWDEAKVLGEKFIHDFPNDRPIVGPAASCVAYIRKHFHQLFHNTASHLEYKRIVRNVWDISNFLVHQLQYTQFGASFPHKVTYHDSCSLQTENALSDQGRMLLSKVKGLELVEMKDSASCCGADGLFSQQFEELSVALAHQKIQAAIDTGAEYLITTDLECLMQLEGYAKKQQLPIKVIHLVDVLASGW